MFVRHCPTSSSSEYTCPLFHKYKLHFFSYVLQCLIATRGAFGVIHRSFALFLLPSPSCHPVHQPPADNDVLIMSLLGQQIALQSHSHAVENCCYLGAPTPLCVSGRLTLASCWEQCFSARAGALSP